MGNEPISDDGTKYWDGTAWVPIPSQAPAQSFTATAVTEDGFGAKTRILDEKQTSRDEVMAMRKAWQDFANADGS